MLTKRTGNLLVWTLSLNLLMLVMVLGSYPLIQTSMRAPSHSFDQAHALALAEAGIDEGLWYANERFTLDFFMAHYNNGGFSTCAPFPNMGVALLDLNGDGCISGTDLVNALSLNGSNTLNWNGWSCNQNPNPQHCSRMFTYPEGQVFVDVDLMLWPQAVLTAEGFIPTQLAPRARREIRVRLNDALGPRFRYAAFGGQRIILKDGVAGGDKTVDSYDSALGAYGGSNANGTRGDISTNASGTFNPDALIGSLSVVNGKLYVTAGAQTSGVTTPGTVQAGQITLPQLQTLPSIVLPTTDAATCWGTSRDLGDYVLLTPDTRTLSADTFYCARSVYVTGQLDMNAGARLYIEPTAPTVALQTSGLGMVTAGGGRIYVNGGSVNSTSRGGLGVKYSGADAPSDFQLYVHNPGTTYGVTLQQGLGFGGVIYADNSSIQWTPAAPLGCNVNCNEVWGSLVAADRVDVNDVALEYNIKFHYDMQLEDLKMDGTGLVPAGSPRWKIKSWEIMNW